MSNIIETKIRMSLKNILYRDSEIRNKFQVRVFAEDLPILDNNKIAYIITEDGKDVGTVTSKRICIPYFEIAENLLIPSTDFDKMKESEIVDYFVKESKILEQENNLFEKLKHYLIPTSKGTFSIRTDTQVLRADDMERQLKGFMIFEQIGACVIQ
jgi:hypothetical protein